MMNKEFEIKLNSTNEIANISSLARVFSANVISQLAENGHSNLFRDILVEALPKKYYKVDITLKDYFDAIYDVIWRNYRNEYVYKNVIIKNILLRRHSLSNSFMLSEFRAHNCKADLVLINGTSNVYEIKTDLDGLNRLEDQLNAYRKVFDKVSVVVSHAHKDKIQNSFDEAIGVFLLTKNGSIRTLREPESLKKKVNPSIIFDSLRKEEYTKIIKLVTGGVPDVPNGLLYNECKKIFSEIKPEIAHDMSVKILKERGECKELKSFIKKVPDSLKAIAFSAKLTKNQRSNFLDILDERLANTIV